MAKDDRLYGRFTLDFADSPKIAPLTDLAFRTLVEMTLHSRRMLSDGFVDERIAKKKWKTKALDELLSNDAVKPSLIKVSGGFRIHDFEEHQQTRADIEKKREAGRAGGKARAQAHASTGAQADAQAPPKLITETETETETSTSKEVGEPLSPDESDDLGTLIPDTWKQNQGHRDKAASLHLDPDIQAQRFAEHATRTMRRLKNWNTGYTNWLRKQAEFAQQRQGQLAPVSSRGRSRDQELMAFMTGADNTTQQEIEQ